MSIVSQVTLPAGPGGMSVAACTVAALALLGCSDPFQPVQRPSDHVPPEDERFATMESEVRPLDTREDPSTAQPLWDRMTSYRTPGLSVAVIEDGQVVHARGYGTLGTDDRTPVDASTVFSAGSVSKVVNAALVLHLAERGELALDDDIRADLSSWSIPAENDLGTPPVTLRQILAHTAGFNVHGFGDYAPEQELPTPVQILLGERPARNEAVRLTFQPGTEMDYSGGGIMVSQVVVEDIMGLPYAEVARQYLFEPLGMDRSTFVSPLPPSHGDIALAHNRRGRTMDLPQGYQNMPEQAASGLWTSADDMGTFLSMLLDPDNEYLSAQSRALMTNRAENSWHGLGPRINGDGDRTVFHHGGNNDFYKAWLEGHPATGDGIVVLTNGEQGQQLAYEMRLSAEFALEWNVKFPDDFETPPFAED